VEKYKAYCASNRERGAYCSCCPDGAVSLSVVGSELWYFCAAEPEGDTTSFSSAFSALDFNESSLLGLRVLIEEYERERI